MKPEINQREGFSLLEVLVALAIMAISFTALLGTQSGHLLLSQRAERMSTAVLLAREKMATIEIEYRRKSLPENDIEETKKIEDEPFEDFPGYGYELNIRKVEIAIPTALLDLGSTEEEGEETEVDPAIGNAMNTISNFLSNSIREVKLVVFWEGNKGEDQIEVVTHIVDLNANFGIR